MKSGEIGRILFGAGGLIIGMLVGVAVTDSGSDTEEALREELAATRAAAESAGERVGGMEGRLTGLEEAMARIEEGAGTLSDKIDATSQGLAEKLEAGASAGQDALNAAMEDIGRRIDAVTASSSSSSGQAPAPEGESAEDAAASDPATLEQDEADAGEAAGEDDAEGLAVGHAQYFEDGKIRVYLSGLSAGSYDRRARLAVNGFDLTSMRAGDTMPVRYEETDCTLTLDAIKDNRAQLSVECP
ncbi:hypothetical protein [Oceanicella sp. SM1341]|uniref:hypothetical protein n=1 Tax=Oceanicella sp. SM1341 TaxID=1548889 RepID=UPI000E4F219C|nr:hypothetical protein [Oceanicella sp. SM1341]